jgi:organic radical activating enzyme
MEKRSINNQNKGITSPTSNSKDSKTNPTSQKKVESPSTKKSNTTNKSASVNEKFSKNIPPVKTLNQKVAETAKAAKQQPTQPKQPAKSINELYAANNKNTNKQESVKKVVIPPVKKAMTKPTDTKKS